MATKSQEKQSQDNDQDQSANEKPEGKRQAARGQAKQDGSSADNGARTGRSSRGVYAFDPAAATRTGLLHLADAWKESGSTYQAIHAYVEVLTRYPGTQTAAAATEGLVDLARRLEQEGRFHSALNIFNKLEALV